MRWIVHSDKPLYNDPWLDIRFADVELPDGRHLEHRVIRTPPGVAVRGPKVPGRAGYWTLPASAGGRDGGQWRYRHQGG